MRAAADPSNPLHSRGYQSHPHERMQYWLRGHPVALRHCRCRSVAFQHDGGSGSSAPVAMVTPPTCDCLVARLSVILTRGTSRSATGASWALAKVSSVLRHTSVLWWGCRGGLRRGVHDARSDDRVARKRVAAYDGCATDTMCRDRPLVFVVCPVLSAARTVRHLWSRVRWLPVGVGRTFGLPAGVTTRVVWRGQ